MSVNIKKNGTLTKLAGLYANINLRLSQLLDTDISSLEDGQILAYNNETGKWENQEAPAGVEVVDNLTTQSATSALSANQGYVLNNALAGKANIADVLPTLITNPANKQILSYDSSSSKWVNSVNGNTVLLGTADPAANLGKEGDLYVKLSSPSYGNSYRIHTRSTGGESASLDVDTIADGAVVATQNINYHWPVQTFPDFSTNYKSSNWIVTITSDNVYGRAKGSTISWPYYQTNDVTLTINPPSVYAIFVKSRGIWIQIGKSPVENFAELKDTNFNNLQNGQLAVYNSTTGKWENQTPNFSDKFIITMTWDEELEDYVLDKTPTEVIDAYNSGYYIIAKTPNTEDEDHFYTLAYFKNDNNELQLGFNQATTYDSLHGDELIYNSLTSETIRLKSEDLNTWEVTYSYLDLCRLEAVIYKDNNVYHCDESPSVFQDIVGLPGGILELVDISDRQVNWGGVKYTLSKIDDNEVYYFTSSEVNSSNELSVKTFVMTPNNTYSDWASIVKYESSGGGSSSDILILKLSEDEETGDIVCDKTPSEVLAAYQAGTLLFLLDTRYDELYLFDNYDDYDDYYHMLFSRCETSYTGLITTVTYDLTSSEDEDVWDDIDYDSTDLEFNHAEISLSNGSYSCSISPTKMNISLQYRSSLGVFLKYTEDDTVYNVSYADFTNDVYHFSAIIKDVSNNFKLRTFVLTASGNSWGSITMNEIPIVDSTSVIKWSEAKTSVKKNLIPNNAVSKTINGVTFTVNADGSVLVNGTNTASDWATTFEISTTLLKAGEYYLSQSYASEGAIIFLRLRTNNSMGTAIKELGNKSQDTFSLSNDTNVYCDIQIRPNGVINNVVIRPMIRLASVEDDTYVPYIPDNTELVRYSDNTILGAKNLLSNIATTITKSGITFTVNTDGTVIVNGTATANTNLTISNIITDKTFRQGSYILSGCPSGGSSNTYFIEYSNGVNYAYMDSGNGVLINSIFSDASYPTSRVYIQIKSGQSFTNAVFKPMIRLASDTDNTYAPYSKTNIELTNSVAWETENILGAKNLLPNCLPSTPFTKNGITFTKNSDGSITCEGIATDDMWVGVYKYSPVGNSISGDCFLKEGKYTLSGCPAGGGTTAETYRMYFQVRNSTDTGEEAAFSDLGNSVTFNITSTYASRKCRVIIAIRSGCDLTTPVTFYPMIRYASIMDATYQPYAMTNCQLTQIVDSLNYYLEQTTTTSTSANTVYTFTDARITANSTVDVYTNIFGVSPSNIVLTDGSCTVTFPAQSSAQSMTCKIYIK